MSNVHTSTNVSFLFSKQVFIQLNPSKGKPLIYFFTYFFIFRLSSRLQRMQAIEFECDGSAFSINPALQMERRKEGKKKHSRTFDAMLESSHLGFHKKGDQSWFPEQLSDSLLSFSPRRNTCSFPQVDSLNAHQSVCVSVCTSQLLMVSAPKKSDRAVSGWHTGSWIVAHAQ